MRIGSTPLPSLPEGEWRLKNKTTVLAVGIICLIPLSVASLWLSSSSVVLVIVGTTIALSLFIAIHGELQKRKRAKHYAALSRFAREIVDLYHHEIENLSAQETLFFEEWKYTESKIKEFFEARKQQIGGDTDVETTPLKVSLPSLEEIGRFLSEAQKSIPPLTRPSNLAEYYCQIVQLNDHYALVLSIGSTYLETAWNKLAWFQRTFDLEKGRSSKF